jgi:hypothetical protein
MTCVQEPAGLSARHDAGPVTKLSAA